jgi:hypothetical protein
MGYLLSVVLDVNDSIAYPISFSRNNSLVDSSVRAFQKMQAVEAYGSKNNLNIYPTMHFLRPAHISISTLTHKSYTT